MSILDPEVHKYLIADMDSVCMKAGIPRKFVETSMTSFPEVTDLDRTKWADYPKLKGSYSGVVMEGTSNTERRMMAITGAFLRNFIDARIKSLNTIIQQESEDHTEPTVLLIPNLHVKTQGGKPMTAWQVQFVYDVLLSRTVKGKYTYLFVDSLETLGHDYGLVFKEHLIDNYAWVK